MFYNYFKEIEKKYKGQLSKVKPIVIRFDGKNITKSDKFNLYENNDFTQNLISTSQRIVNQFENCISYIAMDEVSFIFCKPEEFYNRFADDTNSVQYCLSIFQQYFLSIFWDKMPEIFFGVSIFCIPENKIESYLKYRKCMCKNTAVVYFAKRHKQFIKYQGRKMKDILNDIECSKYTDIFHYFPHFYYGTEIKKGINIGLPQEKEKSEDILNNFMF